MASCGSDNMNRPATYPAKEKPAGIGFVVGVVLNLLALGDYTSHILFADSSLCHAKHGVDAVDEPHIFLSQWSPPLCGRCGQRKTRSAPLAFWAFALVDVGPVRSVAISAMLAAEFADQLVMIGAGLVPVTHYDLAVRISVPGVSRPFRIAPYPLPSHVC